MLATQIAGFVFVQWRRFGRQLGGHVMWIQVATSGWIAAKLGNQCCIVFDLLDIELRHWPHVNMVELVVTSEATEVILAQSRSVWTLLGEGEFAHNAIHVEVCYSFHRCWIGREHPPSINSLLASQQKNQVAGTSKKQHICVLCVAWLLVGTFNFLNLDFRVIYVPVSFRVKSNVRLACLLLLILLPLDLMHTKTRATINNYHL